MESQENQEQGTNNVIVGMPFFNSIQCPYSADAIVEQLKTEWQLEAKIYEGDVTLPSIENDEEENDIVSIEVEGFIFFFSFINRPIPGNEVHEAAEYVYLWENPKHICNAMKSHTLLVLLGSKEESQHKAMTVYTMVVASLFATTEEAIGFYHGSQTILFDKQTYLNIATGIKEQLVPILLWVYIGFRRNEDHTLSAYSFGLELFDKKEIEIIKTSMDQGALFDFMIDILAYVIAYNAILEDGQTIGGSEEEKIPITISKGVYLQGDTIKIGVN